MGPLTVNKGCGGWSGGTAVPFNAARGSSAVGPWENREGNLEKSGPCSWHMDLLIPRVTGGTLSPHGFDCLALTLALRVKSAIADSFTANHISSPLE